MRVVKWLAIGLFLSSLTILFLPVDARERNGSAIPHLAAENIDHARSDGMLTAASPAVVYISSFRDTPIYTYTLDMGPFRLDIFPRTSGIVREKISSGSGFFVTQDGYILTNNHVVSDPDTVQMVDAGDNTELPARVVYRDETHDLALLKISGTGFPTIRLSQFEPEIGETVAGIGNALGEIRDSIATGIVTKLDQNIVAYDDDQRAETLRGVIQTNARMYPGDSGGPLLNSSGEAVGVNVAIAPNASISYSIPASTVRKFVAVAGIKL